MKRTICTIITVIIVSAAAFAGGHSEEPRRTPSADTVAPAEYPPGFYVDSVNGSNENDGTTPNTAWRTLRRLERRKLTPGDTVYFVTGSRFEGVLDINVVGTAEKPITFAAYGDGPAPAFSNPGAFYGEAIDVYGDHVVIDGLAVENASEAGIMINPGANHNVVRNCEISNTGTGVYVRGAHNVIHSNYIHDTRMIVDTEEPTDDDYGGVGIWVEAKHVEIAHNRLVNCKAHSYDYGVDGGAVELYGVCDNAYIHHNVAVNCDGGIEAGGKPGSARNVLVAYNLFYNCGNLTCLHTWGGDGTDPLVVENFRIQNNTVVNDEMCFTFDPNQDNGEVTIVNNIFAGNGDTSHTPEEGGLTHSHNLYYNYRWLGYEPTPSEIVADPLFVAPEDGDFRLSVGSPAIDTAQVVDYTTDLDGSPVPHPATAQPDMGAFEFTSGPFPDPLQTELLADSGFEDESGIWSADFGGQLVRSKDTAKQGSVAVLVTDREGEWSGPVQYVTERLAANGPGVYSLSAWVRFPQSAGIAGDPSGQLADQATVTLKVTDSTGTEYYGGGTVDISQEWTHIHGTDIVRWSPPLEEAVYYVETMSTNANLLVDQCSLTKTSHSVPRTEHQAETAGSKIEETHPLDDRGIPTGKLFAQYPIEPDNLNDMSGNGYHLSAQYGAAVVADEERGWVGDVHATDPGSRGGARFTTDTYNNPAHDGAMTLAMWIKHFGSANRWEGLAGKSASWMDKGWVIQVREDNAHIMFQGSNPGGGLSTDTQMAPPVDQWSHWTFTYAAGLQQIYLNGELTAEGRIPELNPEAATEARLVLGSAEDANNFLNFNGLIDDVFIFSRRLTPDEVQALFDATSASLAGSQVGGD